MSNYIRLRFEGLLDEARARGFKPTVRDGETLSKYHKHITYKCAKSNRDCILYFMPGERLSGDSLTDGKGGYIRYEGKWAENTTPSFVRNKKMKQILGS